MRWRAEERLVIRAKDHQHALPLWSASRQVAVRRKVELPARRPCCDSTDRVPRVAADGTWVGGYGLVISEGPPDVECALTPTGSNNVYDVTSSVAPRVGYDLRQITVYDDNGGSFRRNIIADAEQIVLKPGPNAGRIQDSRDGLVTLTGTRAEFRVLSQWSNTVWGEDQPCVSSVDLGFGRP